MVITPTIYQEFIESSMFLAHRTDLKPRHGQRLSERYRTALKFDIHGFGAHGKDTQTRNRFIARVTSD